MKDFNGKFERDYTIIYFGVGLFLVFMLFWYFTIPSKEVIEKKPFHEMNASEQIEYVKEQKQEVTDDANYRRAFSTDNNAFCDLIENVTLREMCFSEIKSSKEIVVDTRTETEVFDDSNFRRAISTGDSSFCERVVNAELKASCLNALG